MVKRILVITLLSLLLILYFISEVNKTKKYSWEMNFSGISKDPYGCYVIRKTLEDHKNIDFLKTTNATFFNTLPQLKSEKPLTCVVITYNFNPDSVNLTTAYKFVDAGNNMFISAYYFGDNFKDILKFNAEYVDAFSIKAEHDTITLVNPSLKTSKPLLLEKVAPTRFSKIDTATHVVLGTGVGKNANYIKVPYGKGAFYLHTQPLAFSNYQILYSQPEYAYAALSYFANTTLVWDDYYKPAAGKYILESQTPFRYFLSQDALRITIYLILILITIYFFIGSKRRQRFVPILTPLENSTIKFVSTVARLYQGQPDYKKMAEKKFLYLREMVYSRYMLRLDENNPATAQQFSEKTGFNLEKIKELYIIYRRIEASISIDADTLITLSRQVDEIYEFEKDK